MHGENEAAPTDAEILRLYKKDVQKRLNRAPGLVRTEAANATQAVVLFKIEKTGSVSKIRLESSSGNKPFDEYCLQTVQLRSPYRPYSKALEFKVVFRPLTLDLSILEQTGYE